MRGGWVRDAASAVPPSGRAYQARGWLTAPQFEPEWHLQGFSSESSLTRELFFMHGFPPEG